MDWIAHWNANPRPFDWKKTAEEILDSLARYIETPSAGDLVTGAFTRSAPGQWCGTDITALHPREGKLYCASCSTPTPGEWSAGRSTLSRPRPWSPTRSGWR